MKDLKVTFVLLVLLRTLFLPVSVPLVLIGYLIGFVWKPAAILCLVGLWMLGVKTVVG